MVQSKEHFSIYLFTNISKFLVLCILLLTVLFIDSDIICKHIRQKYAIFDSKCAFLKEKIQLFGHIILKIQETIIHSILFWIILIKYVKI